MILIPVGLIRVFVRAFVQMLWVAATFMFEVGRWCFDLLVSGTATDRLYVLSVLLAAPAGYVVAHHPWGAAAHPAAVIARTAPAAPAPGAAGPATAPAAPSADVAPAAIPAGPEVAWQALSASGATRLTQQLSGSECRLSCTHADQVVWREEAACEGNAQDRHFVSEDCERSVVFYSVPTHERARAFVGVYNRTQLAWQVKDRGLTRNEAALAGYHLIQGLGGNGGPPPAYAADGSAVVFTVTDGTSQRVPLLTSPPPGTRTASRPPP